MPRLRPPFKSGGARRARIVGREGRPTGRAAGSAARPLLYLRHTTMSILQGLLNKFGMGEARGRRPVRVFLLDDDTLRHEWFAKQFKGDRLDVAVEPARAGELLSSNYYDQIFLDHDLLPQPDYAEKFDDERT
ncbi:MAG: hypothetical protein ABW250_13120, partial [Pyrinomonadaceae bacterium]